MESGKVLISPNQTGRGSVGLLVKQLQGYSDGHTRSGSLDDRRDENRIRIR